MRIVVFGNASGFGGAQTAFRRLVDFLINDGYTVGVIGIAQPENELPGTGRTSFSLRIDSNPRARFKKLWQTSVAAMEARRHCPEVFVSVGLARSASWLAKLMPRTTFCTAQDFIYGRSAEDPLLRSTTRSFDALAVQSPSMVGALLNAGYSALPIEWLPCFPDKPQAGFCRLAPATRSVIRVAYFGRLASNKGIDLLLHAFRAARFALPVSLDIWGEGAELDALLSLRSSLALDNIVKFRGKYGEGSDFAELLCSYDGLVLTSTGLEGLPLILLEAMAYGVPFLATRVGAIPDCCDGNADAVLVNPTIAAIREGLEVFVTRAGANEFSTLRLQLHYEAHFSHEVMASRWRAMLQRPGSFFHHV